MEAVLADPVAVGPYRVIRRLGAGGMGVVYLAEREGRQVAVKVLRPEVLHDPTFLRRFRREIEVSRKVQGVCTAAVLDADLDAPAPYLVTEYIPGPTLAEHVLAQGPLIGRALVAFAVGLAEALAAIHRAGVVHRDLTASNVLLAPDGPRVVDFGIALGAESTALTGTSVIIGTPSWMAPEQARGLPAGPAVDVFAWAALVVYAACGTAPFGQGRAEAVLYRVVHEDPTLPPLPAPLDQLVPAALAKDPGRRPDAFALLQALLGPDATVVMDSPESAGQAVTALLQRTWVLDHPAPPPEAAAVADDARRPAGSRRGRIAGLFVLLGVVAVVAALGVLWGQGRGGADESVETAVAEAPEADAAREPAAPRDAPGHSPATERPPPEPEPEPEPEPDPEPEPESAPAPDPAPAPEPAAVRGIDTEPGARIPDAADCPRAVEDRAEGTPDEAALCLLAAWREADRALAGIYARQDAIDELFLYTYESPDPDWEGCDIAQEYLGFVCSFYYPNLDEHGNVDETFHGVSLILDSDWGPEDGSYVIYEATFVG